MASSVLTGYGPSSSPANQFQHLLFNGDARKFDQWEVRIMGYLKIKKLKKVMFPEDMNALPADDAEKNELVFAEICQFLDETSLSLVMRDARDKGREAMQILREHYVGGSKPRIISLYTELTSLSKNKDESITDYVIRAERASTSLNDAGEKVSDSLLVSMCLKGLPEDFKPFIVLATQKEPAYTFSQFKQALRNYEETDKSRSHQKGSNKAGDRILKAKCFGCNSEEHKIADCPKKSGKWCRTHKSSTHSDQECRKRNKSTKDKVKKSDDKNADPEVRHVFFKMGDDLVLNSDNSESYLVDCGATSHVVNSDTNFVSTDPTFKPENHFIELADGTRSNNVAKKRGTVEMSLRNENGDVIKAYLHNVLYVPTYPQCIFSVQAATNNGSRVNFDGESGTLTSKDGMRFPIVQRGRLYYLLKTSVHDRRSESLRKWHNIMGHCNVNDLVKLESQVNGMHINDKSEFNCETCTVSKLTNTRNKHAVPRASSPLELVHVDLAGPIDPISINGFRYAMIITDNFSGCIFTYFLKSKSDASLAFEKFLCDVSPYGKVKTLDFNMDVFPSGDVTRLRSDMGGEFISAEFKDILTRHKIKHELTSPHSQHQNGAAERSWRTIFEMARCLICEAKLTKSLWPYAVMYATYIRNRCFNQRIGETPFGLITGKKPDLSSMHLFGSLCYAYVQEYKKKLDARAKRGYFVGFDRDSPSYLVYYPESNVIRKHRVVKVTDTFQVNSNDNGFIQEGDADTTEGADSEPAAVKVDEEDGVQPAVAEESTNQRYPLRENRGVPPDYLQYTSACIDSCYVMKSIPSTYDEAMEDENADDWKNAMNSEIESLRKNDTFIETDIPAQRKVLGGKWVYNVKNDQGQPLFKARYVAQGYGQIPNVDFYETFSPTPRLESLRILVQIAVQYGFSMHQMDVRTAFLHAPLDEEIFIKPPKGYEPSKKNCVWKLKKSLYGLKQSGRNWHILLEKHLSEEMNFIRSEADPCVYICVTDCDKAYILVWVDDLILIASSDLFMVSMKNSLKTRFDMKDLGSLSCFLGIEFLQDGDVFTMSQSKYLTKVLSRFGMLDVKVRTTPCENMSTYEDEEPVSDSTYREAVGSLVYAMVATRPDLSFVVTKLSQHLSNPTRGDILMLKHVFQYIKGSLDHCLVFKKVDGEVLQLEAFVDADWASSRTDRKSITGYCFRLHHQGPVISWKSRKQPTVALSTCEAEYMALSLTCQEAVFLNRLVNNLLGYESRSVDIHCDNQGAIALAKNPVKHNRTKHIDIRHHYVRELVENDSVILKYVQSDSNLADPFTKPLAKIKWSSFMIKLFGA